MVNGAASVIRPDRVPAPVQAGSSETRLASVQLNSRKHSMEIPEGDFAGGNFSRIRRHAGRERHRMFVMGGILRRGQFGGGSRPDDLIEFG
jgi:hypothetical protein